MANALLSEAANLGNAQGVGVLTNARGQAENIAASQQARQQNALSFQNAQQDRQAAMAKQQQDKQLQAVREDLASFLMLPDDNARTQAWKSGLAQHYGADPNTDWKQAIGGFVRSNLGILGPEVSNKVLETHFAPKPVTAEGQPFEAVQNGQRVLVQRYSDGSVKPLQGFAPPPKAEPSTPVTTATVLIDGVPTVVDARTYKPGSKVGIIGPGPRESDAQKRINNQAFGMQGINDSLNAAEDLLKGIGHDAAGNPIQQPTPTASGLGTAVDAAATFVGVAPKGSAQADQLRSIAGSLVAKVPRMQGPQSDKDVALYKQMAGDLGNSSLPIERRLAALQEVRRLYAKYEFMNKPMSGVPTGTPKVLRFDSQGNPVQ